MGRLDGKVALITGGSGQGRSHALALASECAAVVLMDNLQGNGRLLDRLGARYLSTVGDVRSPSDLARTASEAIDAFGRLDIAVCNARVALGLRSVLDTERAAWQLVHDINLTGVFNMVQWFCRHTASQWGVIGLVKDRCGRVWDVWHKGNCICPTSVNAPMLHTRIPYAAFLPDVPTLSREKVEERMRAMHPLRIPYIQPEDVSATTVFLASEGARFISGEALTVSGGRIAMNVA